MNVENSTDTLSSNNTISKDIILDYLDPKILEVKEYIHPNQFKEYSLKAKKLGFKFVASGPLVRSSYNASEVGHHLIF